MWVCHAMSKLGNAATPLIATTEQCTIGWHLAFKSHFHVILHVAAWPVTYMRLSI